MLRLLSRVFAPNYCVVGPGAGPGYVSEVHVGHCKLLEAQLDLDNQVKLIVSGQIGCGKTTMLGAVASALRLEGRLVVYVDIEGQSLDPRSVYRTLLSGFDPEAPKVDDTPDGLFRALHNVLVDLAERRPVLVVDGLDRLPPDHVEGLAECCAFLARMPVTIILVLPLYAVYDANLRPVLRDSYRNFEMSALTPVFLEWPTAFRRVVELRLGVSSAIEETAIHSAVGASAGNLGLLFQVLRGAVVHARTRSNAYVDCSDIGSAEGKLRDMYQRAYDPRYWTSLRNVQEGQCSAGRDPFIGNLLFNRWIIELRNAEGNVFWQLPRHVKQLLDHQKSTYRK